jgi:PTH1 family peptidyl-tRNA hydrolase
MIQLIAGLGNIGAEYERTRHNAGFWLAELLAAQHHAAWRNDRAFHGAVAKATIAGSAVWLLKPSTYMNRSGLAVAALARFYKIAPEQILVLHDEIDIQPGEVKLKLGGGVAGHNGLKSVQAELGSADFWRLRIGVGHPGVSAEVPNYVLHKACPEHQTLIDDAVRRCAEAMPVIVAGEFTRAMQQLHGKPKRKTNEEKSVAPTDTPR